MARLSDIDPLVRDALRRAELPQFPTTPWVTPPTLADARVAIISTAAIHRAGDRPFGGHEGDYRIVPADVDYADLVMTHLSVNFDRSGFQQDVNVAFPLEHPHTLAAHREIGSVATWHYSFMGAALPQHMEAAAREVAAQLKGDGVDLAVLIPI